ncbi:MAG: MBL fold metallo-hydrolase [Phycisphaerales bacterium]|jgi:glyoxylase-like metal-dependent hydrolase (beta-lactamase superfamily II)|nr:MBL fold metallo-hydrolase [Phycisphaerales bacterium]
MTWNWRVLDAGRFALDGGSMFGVVPKALWSKLVAPDSRNRIPEACNCVLLEKDGERVLIETGFGDGWSEKEVDMFGMNGVTVLGALEEHNIDPESIATVILSHLHFDHAAGITLLPNAKVIVQKQEWDDANNNRSTMSRTYLPRVLDSIRDRLVLVDGDATVCGDVRLTVRKGHTWGLQSIEFEDHDGTVCFCSDVMPTRNHVGLAYSMGYDMLPWDNAQTKRQLLEAAHSEGWRLVLYHEPETPVVGVIKNERGYFGLEPI